MSTAKPMLDADRLDGYLAQRGGPKLPGSLKYRCLTPRQWGRAIKKEHRGWCRECGGTGVIEVNEHTCGADPYAGYGHERGCGTEPCPAGCPVVSG